jgi:hypothetical protein
MAHIAPSGPNGSSDVDMISFPRQALCHKALNARYEKQTVAPREIGHVRRGRRSLVWAVHTECGRKVPNNRAETAVTMSR